MLGSNGIGGSTLSLRMRLGSRLGTLCGVFGMFLACLGATQTGPCPIGGGGGGGGGNDNTSACTLPADCDDGDVCTTDTCVIATGETEGECTNVTPAGCDGDHCTATGCVECLTVTECDDQAACTVDACTAGQCVNTANDDNCDDGDNDACTTSTCAPDNAAAGTDGCLAGTVSCTGGLVCDPATGDCGAASCDQASECDDEDDCTVNQCVANVCDFTEQIDCGETPADDLCTTDSCSGAGVCAHAPVVCPNAGEVCDPATGDCLAGATEFTVTATCPGSLAQDGTGPVTSALQNASPTGTVTFQWIVVPGAGTGTFVDAALQNTDFTLTSASSATLEITATDDLATPADATDDVTATDECTISLGAVAFQVNAGSDRTITPAAADFTAGAFAAGSQLVSGAGAGLVPSLAAVTNRGITPNVSFQWEVLSVPDGALASDVTIINTSSAGTGFIIIPALANSSLALRTTGATTNLTNTVVPGTYTFKVTGIDLSTTPTQTDSDEIAYTLTPAFAIPAAAGGSLQGIAQSTGALAERVIRPNSISAAYTVLARLAGQLQFILTDTSAGADAKAAANLNSVTVTPSSPVATTTATANVTSADRGRYTVNAAFSAGAGSIASTATGLTVNVQNAVAGAIDTRASIVGSTLTFFGAVNSTSLTTAAITQFHGARAGAGTWDGELAIDADVNNDGFPEVVIADANILTFKRGITEDPTDNTLSPFGNAAANDGGLDSAGAETLDTFALTDANTTGTVADVGQITSMCSGDFDHDGNIDIAIGEGGFDAGATGTTEGRVLVYYGRNFDGFTQNPFTTAGQLVAGGDGDLAQPSVITRPSADIFDFDRFGQSIACADVNNDGFTDLIVGCPGGGQAVTAAATGILADSVAQVGTTLHTDTVDANTIFIPGDLVIVDQDNTAFSHVRRVTAVGAAAGTDVDITLDIALGTTPTDNETVDEINGATGAVFGFLGSVIRLPLSTSVDDAGSGASFRIIPSASVSGDLAGASVAAGDVSGDGVADIVFGAPGRKDSGTGASLHVAAGAVFVTNGRVSGLSGNISTIDRIFEGNVSHLGFGRRLALGNFNGAGALDIGVSAGVGASLAAVGTGRVYIISSASSNIQTAADGTSTLTTTPQLSGLAVDSNFGANIAANDFNGDGSADLMGTSPSATAANHRVLVVNGSTSLPASLTAAINFNDGASPGIFTAPAGSTLFSQAIDSGLDVSAALYVADAAAFVDVNGDEVLDLFFTGDGGPFDAYAVMGAESTPPTP